MATQRKPESPAAAKQLPKPPMPVAMAEHARRRRALIELAGDDAILILPAAPERVRSHDTHHPYRQDSDFHYLAGFPEPEARRAVEKLVRETPDASVEELIRRALTVLGKG